MFEHLGIVYNAEGEVVNHRSVLKVLLNPIFRWMGFCIGSLAIEDKAGNVVGVGGMRWCKHPRSSLVWKRYELEPGWRVEKRRRIV